MSQSRRTFDWGVPSDYKANAKERYLFAHIEVMQFQPRYGKPARLLRLYFFVGDGNENVIKDIGKQDTYDLDSSNGSLLAVYREQRLALRKLPFATCHQRAGKRDWLFRGNLPISTHEVLTWGNLLQTFGVDREHFATMVQKEVG